MLTIQCDFDDTITVDNVGAALLTRFAVDQKAWQQIDEEYHAGCITVEECNRRQFAHVRVGKREIQEFVKREVEVRPGFAEMVSFCRSNGIRFVIVSNGIDFYIDAILGKLGLSGVERYSGRARVTEKGIDIDYIDPTGARVERGFKMACQRHLRGAKRPIVCIGDGLADIEPALAADHVIARSRLLNHFHSQGLPHFPYEDFYEVKSYLEELQRLYR